MLLNNASILVVDDEPKLREFISRNLSARGSKVYEASNGLEALAIFQQEILDLIILDIMMPNMDGLETCRRIRQTSTIPIIILTALGEESDKVKALDMGADDYLTKPFGVDELMARVRATLRRTSWVSTVSTPKALLYRDIEVDLDAVTVTCRGTVLKLTQTEFKLLHYLMENRGKILPHSTILQNVWGVEYGNEAEYLRVYIGRIRRKIEQDPTKPEYLFTEHGLGYRFGTS
ncbi:MAG: response regulator transcription factor [Chloroflexota bacterium]